MIKGSCRGMRKDDTPRRIFDGESGFGGISRGEENRKGVFSRRVIGGDRHAACTNSNNRAAVIDDAGFCVEGAVGRIRWTINNDRATV